MQTKKIDIPHFGKARPYLGKESDFQKTAMQYMAFKGLFCWHTPNGGARLRREAASFKRQGVLPGVADICGVDDGRFFAIELKTQKGTIQPSQAQYLQSVARNGGFAAVVWGLDGLEDAVKEILKSKSVPCPQLQI